MHHHHPHSAQTSTSSAACVSSGGGGVGVAGGSSERRQGTCGPSTMTNSGLPPQPPMDYTKARQTKYTWSQLNQFVRDNHNNYSNVNLRVPSSLTLADTSSTHPRLPTIIPSPASSFNQQGAAVAAGGVSGQGDCSSLKTGGAVGRNTTLSASAPTADCQYLANGSNEASGQSNTSSSGNSSSYASETRLYYLGYSETSREQTVQYIDLPSCKRVEDWSKLPQPPKPKSLLLPWIDGSAHSCRASPKMRGSTSSTGSSTITGSSSRGNSSCATVQPQHQINTRFCQQPREEQLMRERKRLPAMGITHFETDPACDTIVFLNSKALYYCKPRVRDGLSPTLNSFTRPFNMPSYPSVCPSNPDLIAFVSHRDIYVLNTKFSSTETRLTFTQKPPESPQVFTFLHSYSNEDSTPENSLPGDYQGSAVSAGVPSFVAQEEFDRYVGYWWQPVSSPFPSHLSSSAPGNAGDSGSGENSYVDENGAHCGVYRIMYEEVDESRVEIVNIQNPLSDKCDSYRYPKAGSCNAKSTLRLLTFTVNHATGAITLLSNNGLPHNAMEACVPNAEYLTRCGWCGPGGNYFWSQWLSRDQKQLYIVLSSVSAFVHHNSPGEGMEAFQYMDSAFTCHKGQSSKEEPHIPNQLQSLLSSVNTARPPLLQKIYEEVTNIWINVHDIMHVVESETSDDVITFIFASQVSKYRHLYYVQTRLLRGGGGGGIDCEEAIDDSECTMRPITTGDWEVLGKNIWVDEKRSIVYFMGLKDTELEAHLYVCSYRHTRLGVFRLTPLGFYHSVVMDVKCSLFVDLYSSLTVPPALTLYRLNLDALCPGASSLLSSPPKSQSTQDFRTVLPPHAVSSSCVSPSSSSASSDHNMASMDSDTDTESIKSSDSGGLGAGGQGALTVTSVEWFEQLCKSVQKQSNQFELICPQYPTVVHTPELFSFKSAAANSSSYKLHGLLYRPTTFQRGIKYPCLLYVYAGPQVQIVNNSFKGHQFLRLHSLLSIGFTVVIMDGRGSANRGLDFEGAIRNQLGSVEVQDQLEGLNFIAEKSGCIDLNKVAVHGWSYGGYISLLALAQNPCKFMCAAAAAPVVNWREYDTGYTERYLGLPETNRTAYGNSSVLNYIQHFPSEANRLLIVHGAIDENVHYRHTAMLINSLIMNCKPFVQITYPVERHGLRHTEASEHFETSLLHFFNSNANSC